MCVSDPADRTIVATPTLQTGRLRLQDAAKERSVNSKGRYVARGPTPNTIPCGPRWPDTTLCPASRQPCRSIQEFPELTLNRDLASKPQVPSTSGPFPPGAAHTRPHTLNQTSPSRDTVGLLFHGRCSVSSSRNQICWCAENQPPSAWGFTVPASNAGLKYPHPSRRNSRNCLWHQRRGLQELGSLFFCFFFLFKAVFNERDVSGQHP